MPKVIALPDIQAGLEILCLLIGMIYLTALFVGRRLEFFHPRPSATTASGGKTAFGHLRHTAGRRQAGSQRRLRIFGDKRPSETIDLIKKGIKNQFPLCISQITILNYFMLIMLILNYLISGKKITQ